MLAIALGVYLAGWGLGKPEWEIRAMTFTTMILANLALILISRSWSGGLFAALRSPNPALWWVVGGTLAVLGLVLFVPVLRDLFQLAPR